MTSRVQNRFLNPLLKSYLFFGIAYALLLAAALAPYYRGGAVILGGEGDYVLDYGLHLKKYAHAWYAAYGAGMPNYSPCATGLNIALPALLEKAGAPLPAVNFAVVFGIFFFPFLGVFLIARDRRLPPLWAWALGFFYVANPMMLNYLASLNQWNVFSVSAMPFFFWLIQRLYARDGALFFGFGIASAAVSFVFTNYPMMIVLLLCGAFALAVTVLEREKRAPARVFLRKGVVCAGGFLVFNAWWLLGLPAIVAAAQQIYSRAFAATWLKTVVSDSGAVTEKIVLFTLGVTDQPLYSMLSYWTHLPGAPFVLSIPFLVSLQALWRQEGRRPAAAISMAALLACVFFVKGSAPPLGFFFRFLFVHVPFFYIFKTPTEKFGLFFVFLFTLFLLRFGPWKNAPSRLDLWARRAFGGYAAFLLVPFLCVGIIPDYTIPHIGLATRRYVEPADFTALRRYLSRDAGDGRVFALPGLGNYQICFMSAAGRYYTGFDPLLTNTARSVLPMDAAQYFLYDSLDAPAYPDLLRLYGVTTLVLRPELIPWFGYVGGHDGGVLDR
ncbi:MAG: hypothetical protein ACM3L6_01650, partial [Deltaproteobacteria bacterium]